MKLDHRSQWSSIHHWLADFGNSPHMMFEPLAECVYHYGPDGHTPMMSPYRRNSAVWFSDGKLSFTDVQCMCRFISSSVGSVTPGPIHLRCLSHPDASAKDDPPFATVSLIRFSSVEFLLISACFLREVLFTSSLSFYLITRHCA